MLDANHGHFDGHYVSVAAAKCEGAGGGWGCGTVVGPALQQQDLWDPLFALSLVQL